MKVCACCFRDEEIKQYIIAESKETGLCDYCGRHGDLLDINELLDFFTQFVKLFKITKDGTPLVRLIQTDWNMFECDSVCKNIMSDVLSAVPDSLIKKVEDVVSYNDEIEECVSFWERLKKDLKCNRRFITDIAALEDLGWDSLFTTSVELGPQHLFYRGRIHDDSAQGKYSVDCMGVPPIEKSVSGRANPAGIPYLYLSKDVETTLYETRALYLDNMSVGRFRVMDNMSLNIIDITANWDSFRSPFVNDDIVALTKSKLLMRAISADLSKPMRRYDSDLEYVPTQFICEYIKYIYGADGIMFNSSLHEGGVNYVIFNHEKIECIAVEQHQITQVLIASNVV